MWLFSFLTTSSKYVIIIGLVLRNKKGDFFMVDLKRLHVERYYTDDEYSTALTDFECFVSNLCNYGQAKYAFLRIRKETWEHLVYRITRNHIGKSEAKTLINIDFNGVITQTIKKRFEENPIKLIDDILRSWSYDNKDYGNLIKELIKFLNEYELKIDDRLYQSLKNNSLMFKSILERIGILRFDKNKFDDFIEGKYDVYLELLSAKTKLMDGIDLVNYFLKLLGIDYTSLTSSNGVINEDVKAKIIFLINHYKQLEGIRSLYKQIFGASVNEPIDKVIIKYSLKKINVLFDNYNLYNLTKRKSDLDFIYLLASDVKSLGVRANNKKATNSDQEIHSSIYSFFPLVDGSEAKTRVVLIDYLIDDLSSSERRIIRNGINNGDFSSKFNDIIKRMRVNYDKRIKQVLHPYASIYNVVGDHENISDLDKKQLVDSWYHVLDEQDKDKVIGYIEGDIYLTQKDFEESEKIVNGFIKNYEDTVARRLNPISVYNLVDGRADMSEAVKKEIVDGVLNQMGDKSKKVLEDYINGLIVFSSANLYGVGNVINNFRKDFDISVEIIDSKITYFAAIILFKYNVSIPVNLSFDRIYVLAKALQEKEETLKIVAMMSDKNYKDFWTNNVQQLFECNSTVSLDQLILLYLQILDKEIKLRTEKVSL